MPRMGNGETPKRCHRFAKTRSYQIPLGHLGRLGHLGHLWERGRGALANWRFKDAIEYANKTAVHNTVDADLVKVVNFLAQCVCMDPVCVDQAINVLFAFCTGNDHRIVNGSLRFKDDFPTVFITGSGGGKSPMIIQMFLEGIIKQVKEIIDCIPGGLSSFVTAGASYPGWLTAVHWHHFCTRRWAQSCARLLSPKESKFTPLEAKNHTTAWAPKHNS